MGPQQFYRQVILLVSCRFTGRLFIVCMWNWLVAYNIAWWKKPSERDTETDVGYGWCPFALRMSVATRHNPNKNWFLLPLLHPFSLDDIQLQEFPLFISTSKKTLCLSIISLWLHLPPSDLGHSKKVLWHSVCRRLALYQSVKGIFFGKKIHIDDREWLQMPLFNHRSYVNHI